MTSPEPMTRKELLELAALDAFGLLDEYEAAYFTRSFHHAPATVQDEIKRLQAEVVADESLLPTDHPDAALRQRVLEAVAKAIERETAKLAPLATIGRPRPTYRDAAGWFPLAASSQFWRAAAFVLAGVGLVMAYFFSLSYQNQNELASAALSGRTAALVAKLERFLGPTAKDFLLDESAKIALEPVDKAKEYRAAVFVNETTRAVFAILDGLPADGDGYVLQVVLEDGRTERLQTFTSFGGIGGTRLDDLPATLLASVAIWQITDAAGQIILRSA